MRTKTINIDEINEMMYPLDPIKRVKWAFEQFGQKFCITSSFGSQSAILLHVISQVSCEIPVLFINTGYHLSETIAYRDYLQKLFNLNVIDIKPELSRMEFEKLHDYPNETNQTFCCHHNKVLPLQNALKKYDCWGTGIRRGQTTNRKETKYLVVENNELGRYKLAPIADFTDEDCRLYFCHHNLPEHPLIRKGYKSIGCDCCTSLPTSDDERSGRWNGTKTECGLHIMKGDGDGI